MKGAVFAAGLVSWLFGDGPDPLAGTASLWIGLHTGEPGDDNEAAYPGYERQRTERGKGWTTEAGTATNAARIEFPECGGDDNAILDRVTHYAIYGGAGPEAMRLYGSAIRNPMDVRPGLALAFKPGEITVRER